MGTVSNCRQTRVLDYHLVHNIALLGGYKLKEIVISFQLFLPAACLLLDTDDLYFDKS